MYNCTVYSFQTLLVFTWYSVLYTDFDTGKHHVQLYRILFKISIGIYLAFCSLNRYQYRYTNTIIQYSLYKLYWYLLGILFFIQISIQVHNMYNYTDSIGIYLAFCSVYRYRYTYTTCTIVQNTLYKLRQCTVFTWNSVLYTDIDTGTQHVQLYRILFAN